MSVETNRLAVIKFLGWDVPHSLADVINEFRLQMSNDPNRISYLRICGFACSECGAPITYPNLKFFDFQLNVKCYSCQRKM